MWNRNVVYQYGRSGYRNSRRPARTQDGPAVIVSRFDSVCKCGCGQQIKAGEKIGKPRNLPQWFREECARRIDASAEEAVRVAAMQQTGRAQREAEYARERAELAQRKPQLDDGRYSVVEASGTYRSYRFATVKNGNLAGAQKIAYRESGHWHWFGWLKADGTLWTWKSQQRALAEAGYADHAEADVKVIVEKPNEASLAYAIRESECSRCGSRLTVPASVFYGLGPECAKKRGLKATSGWRKADQQKAYEAGIVGGRKHEPEPERDPADVEAEMNDLMAEHEREMEERGFLSDPGFRRIREERLA